MHVSKLAAAGLVAIGLVMGQTAQATATRAGAAIAPVSAKAKTKALKRSAKRNQGASEAAGAFPVLPVAAGVGAVGLTIAIVASDNNNNDSPGGSTN